MNGHLFKSCRSIPLAVLLCLLSFQISPALAEHVEDSESMMPKHGPRLVMPLMNAQRGKLLFVSKGCVACHAINGVGGHDAPVLDAHAMEGLINPFDFAAKMWNHAAAMIYAQEEALGEQITYTGAELADIIAFVHDDDAQHSFDEGDLTPAARKMMKHEHGGEAAPDAHAKEIGHPEESDHPHAPGTMPHKD